MKTETEGIQSINFTEREEKKKTKHYNNKTHNTKTYIMAFKYIDNLYKEKEINIFSISTVGSKMSLMNETEEHLSEMTQM